MRELSMLALCALLAACGSASAATMEAGPVNQAPVQANSETEAAESGAEPVGSMNAATVADGAAEAALYPDGHLPANWYHYPDDILVLEGGGFSFTQPGLHPARYIDFGLPRGIVVQAVSTIRGRPSGSGGILRCPGGAMAFTSFGPLTLNFRHGRFVGWVLNRRASPLLETFLGLGIGTPRNQAGYGDQDLTSTRNTPHGPQFEINAIGGYLSSNRPNARVTRLYSGATCFARTPPDRRDD